MFLFSKILRWSAMLIISTFVAVVIAVILIVNFVNPNDYREKINQTISNKIHKPFAIQGDINWIFFPSLGFKAQNMSVGAKQTNDLYVKLNTLAFNVQIWPLLHKEIILNAIHIDGMQLILPNTEETNVEKTTAATQSTTTENPLQALTTLPELSLKEISIKNATIIKQNNDKVAWQINDFALDSSDLKLNEKFPIHTHFEFINPLEKISEKINFSTEIKIENTAQQITLNEPKLNVSGAKNSAFPEQIYFTTKKLITDLSKQTLGIKDFSGNVNQLNFSGHLDADSILTTPIANGSLKLTSDQFKDFLKSLGMTLPSMQSANALNKLTVNTDFQYGNNQLLLNPFSLQLDQSTINGTVKSADLKNLALDLSLNIPAINLSNYLAPAKDPQKINLSGTQINLKVLPPASTNKDWLASTINGGITIRNLIYNDQSYHNVLAQWDAKNKIFNLLKFQANAWQGIIATSGTINLQGPSTRFTLKPKIQNIQLAELMPLIEPKFKLSGLVNVTGNISSEGSDLPVIKQNLNGSLNIMTKNGVLYGIDVGYWLNAGRAVIHKQMPPAKPAQAQTRFGSLTATLLINQGIINNQDLLINGPVAQVKGQGTINLAQETLNYHLLIAKTNEDTGAAQNDVIPLIISGSFSNPSIQLDMITLGKQVLSRELEKHGDQLVQKVNDQLAKSKLGQQLNNALGKLLGQ